jgi:hypothetical protein
LKRRYFHHRVHREYSEEKNGRRGEGTRGRNCEIEKMRGRQEKKSGNRNSKRRFTTTEFTEGTENIREEMKLRKCENAKMRREELFAAKGLHRLRLIKSKRTTRELKRKMFSPQSSQRAKRI